MHDQGSSEGRLSLLVSMCNSGLLEGSCTDTDESLQNIPIKFFSGCITNNNDKVTDYGLSRPYWPNGRALLGDLTLCKVPVWLQMRPPGAMISIQIQFWVMGFWF
jgi:hypothetical protein